MPEPTDKPKEVREQGRVLETCHFEEGEAINEVVLRYATTGDFKGIAEINKARWTERSRLELENVPRIRQDVIDKGDLGDIPPPTKEKLQELRMSYKEKLLQCETEGLEFFKKGKENLWKYLGESFSDEQRQFFLVVEVEGRVVGYIEMGPHFDQDQNDIQISTISLMPEFQTKKVKTEEGQEVSLAHELLRQGISQATQETLLKDRKNIVLGTNAWTPLAVGFWVKEGFKRDKSVKETDPYHLSLVKNLQ